MTNHLYIHVPFCLQRCGYCSFYSVAGADDGVLDSYVDALLAEMDLRGVDGGGCKTVYFGGGTPSLLGAGRVARLLARIAAPKSAEVTLEANPETVTERLLVGLRDAGLNRLSLGVQSLVEEDLQYLCRVHDGGRARLAVELAKRTFERVSVDLIYGLPGQNLDGWLEQLEQVVALETEHLSAYELTYEPGTPLGNTVDGNPDRTDYFFATHEQLSKLGLKGYEVSNFARSKGARSRHNLATWDYRPYVGVGPGAHSFSGAGAEAMRRWNSADLKRYLEAAKGRLVPHKSESLTAEQQLLERLMLGLRTTAGVTVDGKLINSSFLNRLARCKDDGLVLQKGGRIIPTLEGMGLADGLAARLAG
jgi:oxygen-independent coproporphyrinogen III oxidase